MLVVCNECFCPQLLAPSLRDPDPVRTYATGICHPAGRRMSGPFCPTGSLQVRSVVVRWNSVATS